MTIAIVNYITSSGAGSSWSFQNFFVGTTSTYNGQTYNFGAFGITGRGARKGGDRSEITLVLGNDPVSLNYATESIQNRHLITIKTVLLEGVNLTPVSLLTDEIWTASSMDVDPEKIAMRLTSPLDAVRQQFPRRQLSSKLVGSLPTTGNLVIS
jgi:hypothetical protein